jgi:hypothetical protein
MAKRLNAHLMLFRRVGAVTVLILLAASNGVRCRGQGTSGKLDGPVIEIEDVNRFFGVYDLAGGRPSAERLQYEYLDRGSDGLHTSPRYGTSQAQPSRLPSRRRQPSTLTQGHVRRFCRRRAIASRPRCISSPSSPEAKFPPVTIAVGRGRPVATGGPVDGVMVGLEALCGVRYFDANVEDRFVHVIAHEYIHVQQSKSLADDEHPTVLEVSLLEGGAEFMGEMISGGVGKRASGLRLRGTRRRLRLRSFPMRTTPICRNGSTTARSISLAISDIGLDIAS